MTKANETKTTAPSIEGLNKADAMDILVPDMGYKKAEVYWKENGAKSKARGFRALFYAELEKKDMNKDEVKAYCVEFGSENDAKQFSHYVSIADLVRSTRAK